MTRKIKLFTGTANPELAEEIASYLGLPMGDAVVGRFRDGEINLQVKETVRGAECFVIQPTCPPADSNLMELLVMIDALKRASAKAIAAVVPYYGYARQDRKNKPRDPICAKLVANLIQAAGADRLLGMDFHTHQLQGFFDVPVDHLYAAPVLTGYFRAKQLADLVVVAPDVGAAKMARGFARRLNAAFAIIDKRRPAPNVAEVLTVVGEVEGRPCLIVDDMIDTAGTIQGVAHALKERGATEIYVSATHALFSGPAVQRLQEAPLTEVVVTNTLNVPDEKRFPKLTILSVAELFAQAIRFTHSNESVSQLFD